MGKPVARKTDQISHGGTIITGSDNVLAGGLEVARLGDTVLCDLHGTQTIVADCSPTVLTNGRPTAHIDSVVSCGATIITGLESVLIADSEEVQWSSVLNKPTAFTPASHAHLIADTTELADVLAAKSDLTHVHDVAHVTNLQTSLDAKANTIHSHSIDSIALLQSVLDAKALLVHGHAVSDIAGVQNALDTKAALIHTHTIDSVVNLQSTLDGKASSSHNHLKIDITDLSVDWSEILNVPVSFNPASHTHTIADVTNLQTTLDGKSDISHTHTIANITNLQTTLDGKSDISHTHTIANITNLQTTLDGKSDTTHNHDATYLKLTGGTVSGLTTLSSGSKLVIQSGNDGGNARGIFYWSANDYNWGSYMSTAGASKSLNAGTSCSSLDGRTSHHIRHRAFASGTQGFIWENSNETCLMSLTSDSGILYTKGAVVAPSLVTSGIGGNSGVALADYGIYQAAGAWTAPFPDLCIAYHTGIRIGAYSNYGGTRFYGNSFANGGGSEPYLLGVGDGADDVYCPTSLRFGSRAGQHLNLYSTTFAIGIQSATLYLRTGGNICCFLGGSHSDTTYNPGSGGTELMRVNTSGLYIDPTNSVSTAWIRTSGNKGWYNETYTGGIYMIDSTWVRTYNGKGFLAATLNSTALAGTGNRLVYSDASGTLTNTASDKSLKTNIESLSYGLSDVLKLNPVSFNWIDSNRFGTQKEIGLIAQEVQEICPEVIGTNSDGTLSLDYQKLIAMLINAIKDQQEEIQGIKKWTTKNKT